MRSVLFRSFLFLLGVFLIGGAFFLLFPSDPISDLETDFEKENEKAAARAEAIRLEQIDKLESEIRAKVSEHLRVDATRLGFALREMEELIDEYELGADLFVEDLHSIGGRGRLLFALATDFVELSDVDSKWLKWSLPVFQHPITNLLQATELISKVMSGEAELRNVTELVEEIWQKAFDGRIDLAEQIANRAVRLSEELEARRNLLAAEIEGPFLELIRLHGLEEIPVDRTVLDRLERSISDDALRYTGKTLGAEMLAFGGGELIAHLALHIGRNLAGQASQRLAQNMAASMLARTGGTLLAGVESAWFTFGATIAVAVIADIIINKISENEMKKNLRKDLAVFRESFWFGAEKAPGIHPQMIDAFSRYQERLLKVFENSSDDWIGFIEPQIAEIEESEKMSAFIKARMQNEN